VTADFVCQSGARTNWPCPIIGKDVSTALQWDETPTEVQNDQSVKPALADAGSAEFSVLRTAQDLYLDAGRGIPLCETGGKIRTSVISNGSTLHSHG
jgi:hypothetical protein